jgi:hypothetical protein
VSSVAASLVQEVATVSAASGNEAQLRHALEKALEKACAELSLPWTPYSIDRRLRGGGTKTRFVDVVHGAVVIEYEPPGSFKGKVGAKLKHARRQAEEYTEMLALEEGRPLSEYVLVAWDGPHINFGRISDDKPIWEGLQGFNLEAATRLVDELGRKGVPLVHPTLLAALAGPDSEYGAKLIPEFFNAVTASLSTPNTTKTKLLFSEWNRLFGQVVGIQSDSLKALLARQGESHSRDYAQNHAAYLFALNSYVALLAKLVAACALPNAGQDILDHAAPIEERMAALESGELFVHAGILNMLSGDFFSWYLDDPHWPTFAPVIQALVASLAGVSFDVTRKSPDSTRDLFKGIYQTFVPRALRHALGEFYTPDWLAEHGLDVLEWPSEKGLLDPTCGSGTFLLEALRRRMKNGCPRTAQALLEGIYGIDLNPLAVLSAKGSLAVYVAPYLDPAHPARLPVFLADAVNPARRSKDGCFEHTLQTEQGPQQFRIPERLIHRPDFFWVFSRIRDLVDEDRTANIITEAIRRDKPDIDLDPAEEEALQATIETFCDLHRQGWNGIWCPIVADRFAAGAIPKMDFICGNPPWVKWSHLPPDYAEFIKPYCAAMGVFSSDNWVGGIESDISTVITYRAIDSYLAPRGKLGFFITGTVFTNESSEGFRQFSLHEGRLTCAVKLVEEYTAIAPFEGVSNRPAFLVLQRDESTTFPVLYRLWSAPKDKGRRQRTFRDAAGFRQLAKCEELFAKPVPGGTDGRPWLIGRLEDHAIYSKVFGPAEPAYLARKGVTTDRNGIFWVRLLGKAGDGLVMIENAARVGRTKNIAQKHGLLEGDHLYPLLRGRGISAFRASPDAELRIIVPQRGMHGDPDLALHSPATFKFLNGFRKQLEKRSSYKRFQAKQGHPFYSLWSTGAYTFAPFKVLWREMSGGGFAAAYLGEIDDPLLGPKLVIPDHKLYFIPVDTEAEAAYLAGFLNAPTIARSISAYAAQLSLGASVAEYLYLPKFDPKNPHHSRLAELAKTITNRRDLATADEKEQLDARVHQILGI